MTSLPRSLRIVLWALLGLVLTAGLLVAVLALAPINPIEVPAIAFQSEDQAMAAIDQWETEESEMPEVLPECRSQFRIEPEAERVAVLFHGFTNCPAQWNQIADELEADGWSVIVPRIPAHGLTSPEALRSVGADEIAETVENAVQIAVAIGEETTVAGLSSGGVFAAWSGTRSQVDRVISIAPAFTLAGVPTFAAGVLERAARIIPDFWWWWDGEAQDGAAGPPYAYKGFYVQSFGQIGHIGQATVRRSPVTNPQFTFLLNPTDPAVNNQVTERLAATWAADGQEVVVRYLPDDGFPHDIIDPNDSQARIEDTYPIVLDLIEGS